MRLPDSTFIAENLRGVSHAALGLSLVAFIDLNGNPKYAALYDRKTAQLVNISPSFLHDWREHGVISQGRRTREGVAGIYVPDGVRPMLLAALPILRNDDSGPTRGTLIMGQWLDSTKAEELSGSVDVSLDFRPVDAAGAETRINRNLSPDTPMHVRVEGTDLVRGFLFREGLAPGTGIVGEMRMTRDIYAEGGAGCGHATVGCDIRYRLHSCWCGSVFIGSVRIKAYRTLR
jgi:adenylate cyclase